jgi:tetratricopeptide (TPR) repeat protein
MNLVSRIRSSSPNSRAGRPGWRRCSALTNSRFARSSRLASRAPRSGILATNFGSGTLGIALLLNAVLAASSMQSAHEPAAIALREFERGDYRSAVSTLSAALAESPHDGRLFHWRSRSYLEQQDYSNAISDAERAVSERPDNSEYHRWLGRAYGAAAEQARSFSLARKVRLAFEQAVQLDPSNLAARRDLVEFYLQAPWIVGGGSGKALKQVEAIVNVDAVAGHLAHAAYSLHEKRLAEAEADYQCVLDLRPDRIEPYLEVADFYEARGDAAKFASVVEQAARLAPSDARLAYYNGVALVLANRNLAEADRFFRTYLAASPRRSDLPSHATAHEWLGRLNERQGNTKAAADEYRAALALDPDRRPVREALRRLETAGRAGSQRP